MRWLIEVAIALFAGTRPSPQEDRSIVGKSRMDLEAHRIEAGCASILLLLWIAWSIARWQRWL